MTKKLLAVLTLGTCLTITGMLLLVMIIRNNAVNIVTTPPVPTTAQSATTAASTVASSPEGSISGAPERLIIPSLNMNVSVIPGYYDAATGEWTLTKTNVQYATPTVQPNNQSGNTFIYGHALSNLFGSLPKIQSGATAMVQTSNGHTFYYTLASTKVVDPSDSAAVFGYTGKPILTLQTCVGLLYQSRELLTFNFQKVA